MDKTQPQFHEPTILYKDWIKSLRADTFQYTSGVLKSEENGKVCHCAEGVLIELLDPSFFFLRFTTTADKKIFGVKSHGEHVTCIIPLISGPLKNALVKHGIDFGLIRDWAEFLVRDLNGGMIWNINDNGKEVWEHGTGYEGVATLLEIAAGLKEIPHG